jgi:hypothetical protein
MARLITLDLGGKLVWTALSADGSAAGGPDAATLRPGSSDFSCLCTAAARGDTLAVVGSQPSAVYVYDGQSGGQGPPLLRSTITALSFPARDAPYAVALSPDGQRVAIGTDKGDRRGGNEEERSLCC